MVQANELLALELLEQGLNDRQGDAKAASLYAESFGRDPQFAQFYRSLEAYKSSFNSKGDVMVLDPGSSEFFKGMRGSAGSTPARK